MNRQPILRPNARAAARHRFTPRLEALEERATPATLYIDDTFKITTNVGPAALSNGDTVTWNPGQFGETGGLTFGTSAFRTLRDAAALAADGDVILVAAGSYTETGQTVIGASKHVTVIGAGSTRTTFRAAFDTAANGDERAWILVSSGAALNFRDATLNGIGRKISEAVRVLPGSVGGTFNRLAFKNIRRTASERDGLGMTIHGGTVDVLNCTFSQIGRIGVQYLNSDATGRFSGNVYVGKGSGNFLDSAIEVGDGAHVLISGNQISNCRGITQPDAFESAGILVDTVGGPGTVATIIGNRIFNNLNGIFVGIQEGDSDSSTVVAHHNNFTGNLFAIFSTNPTVDARFNWWGSTLGPLAATNPNGKGDFVGDRVTFAPFARRVQAVLPVATEADYQAQTAGLIAVGLGPDGGTPQVKVLSSDGATIYTLTPFPDLNGALLRFGAHVAIGDVTGDGIPDVVAGIGLGGGGLLRVFDGLTQARVRSFTLPFGTPGGVNVAVGDVNGDGIGDVIAGAASGVPNVAVFNGRTGTMLRLFNAFPGSTNRGGVNVASGDVNGDGFDDIILGSGIGAAPSVRVVSGKNVTQQLLVGTPYDAAVTGGVSVAAADLDGDGLADVVTAAGPGAEHTVKAFKGTTGDFLFEIGAFPGFNGGINVAAADLNGDLVPEIVVAPASGLEPRVRIFDGTTHLELSNFLAFGAAFTNGISVAAV